MTPDKEQIIECILELSDRASELGHSILAANLLFLAASSYDNSEFALSERMEEHAKSQINKLSKELKKDSKDFLDKDDKKE
jgi:hypothetical protein